MVPTSTIFWRVCIGFGENNTKPYEYSRIMCWWGIWILCLSPTTNGNLPPSSRAAQYGAIVSPIFTVMYVSPRFMPYSADTFLLSLRLLMFGSGIPTAEKPAAKKFYLLTHGPQASSEHSSAWPRYKSYLQKTSILIPLPPQLYRPVPSSLKKTVFLDFEFYQFHEERDGPAAIKEARGT